MEIIDAFNLAISFLALFISGITAWLTLFRKGILKMTRPNIICFAFDSEGNGVIPKIFLRTLLYATSTRGIVAENISIKVTHNESSYIFGTWAYGDTKLVRGSGIFVGAEGIATHHHFLLPPNNNKFEFISGDYIIEVYASVVGNKKRLKLIDINLSLTEENAKALKSKEGVIWFDWIPESQKYKSEILSPSSKSLWK